MKSGFYILLSCLLTGSIWSMDIKLVPDEEKGFTSTSFNILKPDAPKKARWLDRLKSFFKKPSQPLSLGDAYQKASSFKSNKNLCEKIKSCWLAFAKKVGIKIYYYSGTTSEIRYYGPCVRHDKWYACCAGPGCDCCYLASEPIPKNEMI